MRAMTARLSLVIVLGLAVLAVAPDAQAQQPGVRAVSGGVPLPWCGHRTASALR